MRAILWTNGMLMVFDDYGNQVPAYQGKGSEMIPKLRADFPDVEIEGRDWNSEVRPGQRERLG